MRGMRRVTMVAILGCRGRVGEAGRRDWVRCRQMCQFRIPACSRDREAATDLARGARQAPERVRLLCLCRFSS